MNPEKASTGVIVGGGIIGLACALQLRARGIATLLVDEETALPRASWGNAGHIAVEQVEPLASMRTLTGLPRRLFCRGGAVALPPRDIATWLPFAWRLARASFPGRFHAGKAALAALLARAMPAWRRLAQLAGAGDLFVEDGHFVVWESPRAARDGRAFWRQADIGTARVREVTREESTQIATLVSRIPADAIRFSGTARVRDPGLLIERLRAALATAGGETRT